MSASFLASLFIFVITGFYATIDPNASFTGESFIDWCVKLSIIANAIYFFSFAFYTEAIEEVRKSLKNTVSWQWQLRVVNQSLLFGLWFAFSKWGIIAFAIILLLLHINYLFWDWLTKSAFKDKKLFKLDVWGLVAAIIFWVTALFLIYPKIILYFHINEENIVKYTYFAAGAAMVIYIAVAWHGLQIILSKVNVKSVWNNRY